MGPNQPGGPDSSSSLPNVPQGQGQIVGVQNQGVDVNGPGQGSNHGNYQVPGGHLVPMYQQPQIQIYTVDEEATYLLVHFVFVVVDTSEPSDHPVLDNFHDSNPDPDQIGRAHV